MIDENSSSAMLNLQSTNMANTEIYDYLIRRADLDDVDHIQKAMSQEAQERLNLLYDFPSIVRLFER